MAGGKVLAHGQCFIGVCSSKFLGGGNLPPVRPDCRFRRIRTEGFRFRPAEISGARFRAPRATPSARGKFALQIEGKRQPVKLTWRARSYSGRETARGARGARMLSARRARAIA